MGGRGTYAAGRNVPYTYKTVGLFHGVKVLEGMNGLHGLPEEAHSSSAYAKLYRDGNLQMLRFYGENRMVVLEIGYHPEPKITGHHKHVYHIHEYKNGDFKNRPPRLMTAEEIRKYGTYL